MIKKPPSGFNKKPFSSKAAAMNSPLKSLGSAALLGKRMGRYDPILGIASSTGGTEALKELLSSLPPDIPCTVVVQHMPPVFTNTYAASLNEICAFEVKEATTGDILCPGKVFLAPGDYHMEIDKVGDLYRIKLHQRPILHGVRPSADYLLQSIARFFGDRAIGVVLTGMGKDGAQGLLEMQQAGSYNIAQDEASSVVFGMAKEAIQLGAIDKVLPLNRIADAVMSRYTVMTKRPQNAA